MLICLPHPCSIILWILVFSLRCILYICSDSVKVLVFIFLLVLTLMSVIFSPISEAKLQTDPSLVSSHFIPLPSSGPNYPSPLRLRMLHILSHNSKISHTANISQTSSICSTYQLNDVLDLVNNTSHMKSPLLFHLPMQYLGQ